MPSDLVLVVSADFDDEMRGIADLADATPMVEMIERLAGLGHRRFFHVAGSHDFASARARASTFLATLERLGLESTGVFDGDWSGHSGIAAVETIRAGKEPTAIIAANDLVATGVLRAAAIRGWDVPGDVSVTGWDNAADGEFLIPSLTTVDVNLERVGQQRDGASHRQTSRCRAGRRRRAGQPGDLAGVDRTRDPVLARRSHSLDEGRRTGKVRRHDRDQRDHRIGRCRSHGDLVCASVRSIGSC